MNRVNNWEQTLEYANEELGKYGFAIKITEPEDEGFFNCEIWREGKLLETYAENHFEDELGELVDEAWNYVILEKVRHGRSAAAKKMVAEQIIGMLENNVLQECGMESFMGWVEDGDTFYDSYEETYSETDIEDAIALARDVAPMVDEISWRLNV